MRRSVNLATASSLGALVIYAFAGAIAMLLAFAFGCTEREREPCKLYVYADTTGNPVTCACVCESEPDAQCPMLASDPTRSAIPACWDEGSSST